jgi:UDP-N-acetylmuramyl pentapeptide phosphotransferase/UDP-N-acetylglucosamine-1-phosphate transferase
MDFALILASISFLLAVGWGPLLIRLLRRYGIGKRIRIDGPSGHQIKLGTPTMGGLMIVVPVLDHAGAEHLQSDPAEPGGALHSGAAGGDGRLRHNWRGG